jgi:hypothetical protein
MRSCRVRSPGLESIGFLHFGGDSGNASNAVNEFVRVKIAAFTMDLTLSSGACGCSKSSVLLMSPAASWFVMRMVSIAVV